MKEERAAAGTPIHEGALEHGRARRKKRCRGAAPLSVDEAAALVRARASSHGSARVNLKGQPLASPAAVRAVCNAVLCFSRSSPEHPAPIPTTTLNLVRRPGRSSTSQTTPNARRSRFGRLESPGRNT